MIGLLEVTALALTLLAAATWGLVVIFAPAAPTGARGLPPSRRLFRARAWLYAPMWVPLVLVAAAVLPGLLGVVARPADHCLLHGSGHQHHLCLVHPPHAADTLVAWLLPLVLAVPAGILAATQARRVWSEWRLTRALVGVSRPSSFGSDVRILDQAQPLALTVGWRRPTVLLSRGLLAGVSPGALEVVLAHERAHVARGDTRRALLDRLAASVLPRRVATRLLDDLTLAREQACDALAAERVGSPVAVARALTEVLRLGVRAPAIGVSAASGAIEARVLQLLKPPSAHRTSVTVAAVFLLALVAAGTGPVHDAIEHLITALLH